MINKQILIVVESPTKTKTVEKYTKEIAKKNNSKVTVLASYGHIYDLARKKSSVDPANNFAMNYIVIEKNEKYVDKIAKAAKKSDLIYLATDPDREGEAISYNIYQELVNRKSLKKGSEVFRAFFYEITQSSIEQALLEPRQINMDLVDAQQARRALDFLVGFNLSPVLWRKVKPGLSAGRVQSPALAMIVKREQEISKFEPKEYWSIKGCFEKDGSLLEAKLQTFAQEKVAQFSFTTEDAAKNVKDTILSTSDKVTIGALVKKKRKKTPPPPFITSSLQQEANRKLGFSTKKTMQVAQQLYEGIKLENGEVGLITYMRTDAYNLSSEAVLQARAQIDSQFGVHYCPKESRVYKKKVKNAQEAHEAIRPTDFSLVPKNIKNFLTSDQFRLYDLIWSRSIACQMIDAIFERQTIELTVEDLHSFVMNGSKLIEPGFLKAYDIVDVEQDNLLPDLSEGEQLVIEDICYKQHFTEPPARYNEASIVKSLEEQGIGRPSTYSSIIGTLRSREYVVLDQKKFTPTDVGVVVSNFLTNYFGDYTSAEFTSKMEFELDKIALGEAKLLSVLSDFWEPLSKVVNDVTETVSRTEVTSEKIDKECPECSKELLVRLGRSGKFIGCSGYPECKYVCNLDGSVNSDEVIDRLCPKCESSLVMKQGKYGKFIGCSGYPKCRHIEQTSTTNNINIACPECQKGNLQEKRTRFGKSFFGCSEYPDCKYAVWGYPVEKPCPDCGSKLLTVKETKRKGKQLVCPVKECKYEIGYDE